MSDAYRSLRLNLTTGVMDAAVTAAIAAAAAANMKGGIDCSANPDWPAGIAGDSWRVTVAGKIGGAGGQTVSVGDVLICFITAITGTDAAVGANWVIVEANIPGITGAGTAILTAADYAVMRTLLGLVIGTNVQAYSTELASLAAITGAAYGRALLSLAAATGLYTAVRPAAYALTNVTSAGATITLSWNNGPVQKVKITTGASGTTTIGVPTTGAAVEGSTLDLFITAHIAATLGIASNPVPSDSGLFGSTTKSLTVGKVYLAQLAYIMLDSGTLTWVLSGLKGGY